MDKTARVFVAGARGLVGSALVRRLAGRGLYPRAGAGARRARPDGRQGGRRVLRARASRNMSSTRRRGSAAFMPTMPSGRFHPRESADPDQPDRRRLSASCDQVHVLGSSCIYPKLAPQPMNEDDLLTGPLEPTNSAYAVAKIAGIEMIDAYRRQYGFKGISLMPTNLYGPGDNYNLDTSHVLPALIRKFHEAKLAAAPSGRGLGQRQAAPRVPPCRRSRRCLCVSDAQLRRRQDRQCRRRRRRVDR